MKTKSSAVWLILSLASRLSAQNSASHQIIINIIQTNSVSVSSLPAQSVTSDPSADPSSPVSLLKWQTNGRSKKITLSSNENQPIWVETESQDLKRGQIHRLSDVDQNLLSAWPRGHGQCRMKWLMKNRIQNRKPVRVALTVVEN